MFIRTLAILSLFACSAAAFAEESIDVEHLKFFESKVRPLLASKCVSCHNAEKQKGELRLDSLDGMLQGGESGAALVPGKPDESLLIDAINYTSYEMPPTGQMSADSIEILTRWVKMGAPWPEADSNLIRTSDKSFTDEDRSWWAIQPVEDPAVPDAGHDWARNEIDHFVARKLEQSGLKPAPEADRYELVRRAYFDLHGLPPTPEQVAAFVNDDRPDAWQRLIRELLDSPRYGERWAQHWLDVVRFAESDGYNEDAFRPSAGAYRDYVIRSMNEDKPYNQFVREQLAGDEINPDDPNVFIGTSYLRLGIYEWNQRNARMHWDIIINDMTRVTGEAFLGIGIGCAQCHDHKFDPILQKDYFGLQAFLSSVSWPMDQPLGAKEEVDAYRQQEQKWEEATQAIRAEMDEMTKDILANNEKGIVKQFPEDVQAIYNKPEEEKTTYDKQLSYLVFRQAHRAALSLDYEKSLKSKPEKLERYVALKEELKKFDSLKPKPLPNAFVATDFGTEPAPTYLLTRTTTEEVQPSFLALLGDEAPQITPTTTTTGRRTALADWMVREKNPLSTRVIVNRVWQRHLGKGIVPTPNDFGTLGEPPSHPELLDWLTTRFLEEGWKIKPLHELIMNSATYRQTARREPSQRENNVDPTNRLLWRYPPQRLDAEEVRDAQLAISGELKQRDGGASVDGSSPYRSVFVKKMRNRPDEMLRGFDAPLGFESASERIATTTPLQSLLLVNGKWSLERSRAFAKRLLAGKKELTADDVRLAYQLAYGRAATDDEVNGALAFVSQQLNRMGDSPIAKSQPEDKFPNETGLRPIGQYFGSTTDFQLGDKSLWLQPDSRFERLHIQKAENPGDQFTVEAVVILDRIYDDASVNTVLSRWNGGTKSNGWNIGVTSKKSAYHPQNFIVQLVGRTFQDEPAYEVVASGLTYPLGKPVYLAAVISATPSKENPTSGYVTFYMKDLSDPNAKLETSTVETSVVSQIQNPALKIIAGGREAAGHLWDGQLAKLTISQGALPQEQLLVGPDFAKSKRILDWTFNGTDGEHPAPDTAWLRETPKENPADASNKMLGAVTDFCQALFNSNEFLYLH
ncbi:PSD1 and planctomycete cytochrome C domain-containing protein [Blastopirellula sp. JC732]|uniref:PSD1 and planctomycete cytochrome C domain-containing protein n=1 Tax=Blastopirellula sediminis TaxID=2894196 RepID=A0A9X1MQI6_9BACT|nr:PSD1 and planctomycete cytochrome C domain-containing protein [Blastopirellula sediminis]MCC9606161.1 PSD1 and planctomycete cytochrome C domain-containing protein [Blastopirellula sediminis]MCC9630540.1 PSD1 and planctomycete cytochrome C domain-containing protein [Blastopirellula sediminis]